ncbi:MAG TPA: hypothetical protein VLY03_08615 [Bacteroidota bacterium]|nr:hypothetical protein [Bacteroidota bacterium]
METQVLSNHEVDAVEAVRSFWEKVRQAGEIITRLREEKRELRTQVESMDRELQSLRSELRAKEQDLKRIRSEHAQVLNSNGHEFFSGEEREAIKTRIRELLAKINSHL